MSFCWEQTGYKNNTASIPIELHRVFLLAELVALFAKKPNLLNPKHCIVEVSYDGVCRWNSQDRWNRRISLHYLFLPLLFPLCPSAHTYTHARTHTHTHTHTHKRYVKIQSLIFPPLVICWIICVVSELSSKMAFVLHAVMAGPLLYRSIYACLGLAEAL